MRRRHALLAATPLAAAGLIGLAASGLADTAPLSGTTSPVTSTLKSTKATTTSGTSSTTGSLTGAASAQVISITPLQTCVSCTSASAGPGSAKSNGTALELLGQNVSGGDSNGSGAIFALPANPLIALSILDWTAASQAGTDSSTSSSRAAVADLALAGGQVATVAVLESGSHASYASSGTAATAKGSSENNGVVADVGQGALVVILLHSDASSSGSGDAYVASINGNEILSSSQTGGIPIDIPGVGTITLLATNASGGTTTAAVGTAGNVLGQPGTQATALGSSGSGGSSGVLGSHTTASPSPSPSSGGSTLTTTSSGPGIPFTGAELGLAGFLLVAGGGGALGTAAWLQRRRAAELS
jgi:hypothetical protein